MVPATRARQRHAADGAPVDGASDNPICTLERALTRLVRLAHPLRPHLGGTAPQRPLDRAGYAVLARIEELEPVRLTELASVMDLDISTTSRHVRSLEERALLERIGVPGDQRARLLKLSDTGRASLVHARELRRERIGVTLADWEERDLAELARLLDRLVHAFARPSGDARRRGRDLAVVPADTEGAAR